MDCPDENTIARIQAGTATAQEQAEFHEHLDQCLDCLELIEVLSHLDNAPPALIQSGQSESHGHDIAVDRRRWPRTLGSNPAVSVEQQSVDLRVTTVTMVLTQLTCALLLVPARIRLSRLLSSTNGIHDWHLLWQAWVAWLTVCLVAGPALALCSFYGLVTKRRWAVPLLRSYAATAAATLLMLPMAICLLVLLRRGAARVTSKE